MARKAARKRKDMQPIERAEVNPFAAQHGIYMRESDDSDKAGRSTTLRNRAVTTTERWKAKGLLSETQIRGIEYCDGLWDRVGTSRSLVQDLNKISGMPGGDGWSQQEALDELSAIKAKVPPAYFAVFELVCRFDEPGGTAGSRWSSDNKHASTAALMCVRMVADLIVMWRRL